MMKFASFIFTLCIIVSDGKAVEDYSGSFWQWTDMHWDWQYSEVGDEMNMCHNLTSSTSLEGHNGAYGNYLCDAPWALVSASIEAMKNIEARPNFIVWTGDNVPHVFDPPPSFDVIYKTFLNMTLEIRSAFDESIPIIPVLGNHDSYPQDSFPFNDEKFYTRFLVEGGWNRLIPEQGWETFKKGGYFEVSISPKLSVISLNVILYFYRNKFGTNEDDPAGQLKWLRERLKDAVEGDYKVVIAGHAPPGFWERFATESPFYNKTYNDHYVDIINEFGEVILTQVYGHEHTDSFRIFATSHDDKNAKSVGFIAPSVTPWFADTPGGTSINPSVRLYSYNRTTLTDYFQYHMNLTEANDVFANHTACTNSPSPECRAVVTSLWKLYYQATEAYNLPSMDVSSVLQLYKRITKDDSLLQKYYQFNSAGVKHSRCNDTCRTYQLCAMTHLKMQHFFDCLNDSEAHLKMFMSDNVSNTGSAGGGIEPVEIQRDNYPHTIIAITVALVSLTIILGVMLVVVVVRQRKIVGASSVSEFEWVNRHSGYRPLDVDGD